MISGQARLVITLIPRIAIALPTHHGIPFSRGGRPFWHAAEGRIGDQYAARKRFGMPARGRLAPGKIGAIVTSYSAFVREIRRIVRLPRIGKDPESTPPLATDTYHPAKDADDALAFLQKRLRRQ